MRFLPTTKMLLESDKGSISMIETVVIMSVGLIVLLASIGFGVSASRNSVSDACLISGSGRNIDLADPQLNVKEACTAKEWQSSTNEHEK